MAKYFLNIRQSGKSDDMEGNITYDFDLETPLFFHSEFLGETKYKHLKIKTSKNENDFFLNTDNKGGIGKDFSPVTTYWNLCVPDDMKGFSMLGIDDKLTLGDEEGKIYLEPLTFRTFYLKNKTRGNYLKK